jgi:bifunctional DNA primase/polymerase-like protein
MHYQYKANEPMSPARNLQDGGLRDAALTWANMSFSIIPVRNGDKAADPGPLGGAGYKLSDAGIVDPQRVSEIWTAHPGRNIGIVCGAPSRLLVIDGDRDLKKNPHANPMGALLKWQETTGIEIPAGPVVETPSGGFHLYLRLSEGVGHVPSPGGWLPNVDIRADGSYVVAPPSYRNIGASELNPEGWAQYALLDLGGSPYDDDELPSQEEFLAELDEAVAPLGLIEDIRSNGSTRTKRNARGGSPRAAGGQSNGLLGVAWYLEHGIPDDAVQWDVLYADIAWPMLNAGYDRDTTVATMRAVIDHKDTHTDSWDPWITGRREDGNGGQTLWGITNRAYTRAETMDGDDYYEAKRQKHIEETYGELIAWQPRPSTTNLNEKGTAK